MQSYITSDVFPLFSISITIDGIPSTFDFDINDIYDLNTSGKYTLEKHVYKFKNRWKCHIWSKNPINCIWNKRWTIVGYHLIMTFFPVLNHAEEHTWAINEHKHIHVHKNKLIKFFIDQRIWSKFFFCLWRIKIMRLYIVNVQSMSLWYPLCQ